MVNLQDFYVIIVFKEKELWVVELLFLNFLYFFDIMSDLCVYGFDGVISWDYDF